MISKDYTKQEVVNLLNKLSLAVNGYVYKDWAVASKVMDLFDETEEKVIFGDDAKVLRSILKVSEEKGWDKLTRAALYEIQKR